MRNKIKATIATGLFTAVLAAGCATQPAASAQASPPAPVGHHARIGELDMYYELSGSGRPLVLIHGGGSTAQTSFGKVVPALAKTHQLIEPEMQGHGHTPDIERPFSFEQMADDTAALLAQLGVKQVDALGFSNGGRVALLLALRHPGLVRRLILASGHSKRDAMPPQFWEGMQHASADNMPPPLRDAYQAASPKPDLQRFVAKTKDMMLSAHDVPTDALRALQVPTLIMCGDQDVVRPEYAMELFRTLPHAELAIFPGSPHGTYLGAAETAREGNKQPEMVVAMVEEFLNK
jgi:pimeloyl-ACP methyl ester carboxylesterase